MYDDDDVLKWLELRCAGHIHYEGKICTDAQAADEIKRVREERDLWKRTAVEIATWEWFESAERVAEDFYKEQLKKELEKNNEE